MIVRPAPREHYGWIAERAGLTAGPDFHAIEAVDASGRILGMIGFDGWTPGAVCLHIALESPIALRQLMRTAARVAFIGFDRRVVLGSVMSTNERALRLDRHLGFRELCQIRDGWAPGVDLVLFEMRREDCRFLKETA